MSLCNHTVSVVSRCRRCCCCHRLCTAIPVIALKIQILYLAQQHTPTHTCACGKSNGFVASNPHLNQIRQNHYFLWENEGNHYFKSSFKPNKAKIVTLYGTLMEINFKEN